MSHDDPFRDDQPYVHADLLKPGFDPYEAHKAWNARQRLRMSASELVARQDAAIERILAAIQEEAKRPKRKRKCREPKRDEAAESVALWKAALKDIKGRCPK